MRACVPRARNAVSCYYISPRPAIVTGKSASGLKEVADSFAEGMSEGDAGVNTGNPAGAVKSAAAEDEPTKEA